VIYSSAKHLDADEKGMCGVHTLGGEQTLAIISEPGLYRAIMQRPANKKHDASLTAKIQRFQRWVFRRDRSCRGPAATCRRTSPDARAIPTARGSGKWSAMQVARVLERIE
jgi:hypothetical protein